MRYELKRLEDNHISTGRYSKAIFWKRDEVGSPVDRTEDGPPQLNASCMVLWNTFDYWLTTAVQEILEQTENYVKFKTLNSTYEWRQLPDPKE